MLGESNELGLILAAFFALAF